ncbi:50S ribosomal protein L32 [Anaerolineae bacterium CFX7]|nr:50S ribosomal protein L32 [Anaerolineae bacterium CFX7]
MPPLPKRKTSKGRRDRRRSHLALKAQNLTECPNCHNLYIPHRVCPTCGYYNGDQVFEIKESKKTK